MTSDEVKQSVRNWCSSDNDLEIGSDRFEPSTEFAFTVRTAVQSSSPVELLVLKGEGADRVTIRRSVTLTGDNVDAARKLIELAPRVGHRGGRALRPGYDGRRPDVRLPRRIEPAHLHPGCRRALPDRRAARRSQQCRDRHRRGGGGGGTGGRRGGSCGGGIGRACRHARAEPGVLHPGIHHAAALVPAALAGPVGVPDGPAAAAAELHSAARSARSGPARRPAFLHAATGADVPGTTRAGAARPAARPSEPVGPEPLGPAAGPSCVGRSGPVGASGCQPRSRPADPGRRGPWRVGSRDLLQRMDGLDRRPDHRRRRLTTVPGMRTGSGRR